MIGRSHDHHLPLPFHSSVFINQSSCRSSDCSSDSPLTMSTKSKIKTKSSKSKRVTFEQSPEQTERKKKERNERDRQRRARAKLVGEARCRTLILTPKTFPCLTCHADTDVENARVCEACVAHKPRGDCFQCGTHVPTGTCAYIVETEDTINGYSCWTPDTPPNHVFAPTCAPPRAYYHYAKDAWRAEARQRSDYSAWQRTGWQKEICRILPCHVDCALRLPYLAFWPAQDCSNRSFYAPITQETDLVLF